jgi:ketosteroid isomerase-like protein
MPPETPDLVELTRSAYASLNRREFDAMMDIFGPTSVWDVSRWGLGAQVGAEAIRRFLEDWFGSLEEYQVEVQELLDLGGGVVLAVVVQVGRRAGSHGYLRLRSAPVFEWVQGKVARITLYPDIEEGREAAERAAASRD